MQMKPEKIQELRQTLAKMFRAMNDSRLRPKTRLAAKNHWESTRRLLDAIRDKQNGEIENEWQHSKYLDPYHLHQSSRADNNKKKDCTRPAHQISSAQLTPQIVYKGSASMSCKWVPLEGHPNENKR